MTIEKEFGNDCKNTWPYWRRIIEAKSLGNFRYIIGRLRGRKNRKKPRETRIGRGAVNEVGWLKESDNYWRRRWNGLIQYTRFIHTYTRPAQQVRLDRRPAAIFASLVYYRLLLGCWSLLSILIPLFFLSMEGERGGGGILLWKKKKLTFKIAASGVNSAVTQSELVSWRTKRPCRRYDER